MILHPQLVLAQPIEPASVVVVAGPSVDQVQRRSGVRVELARLLQRSCVLHPQGKLALFGYVSTRVCAIVGFDEVAVLSDEVVHTYLMRGTCAVRT